MKSEKDLYLEYLEDLIRRQKGRSPYLSRDSSSYEPDVESIIQQFFRENPDMADSSLAESLLNNITVNEIHETTLDEVRKYLAKTEKGSVHSWKDENGKTWFFVNKGSSGSKKDKQIDYFDAKVDKETIRNSLSRTLIRKDIEDIYDRRRVEQENKQERPTPFSVSDLFRKKPEPENRVKAARNDTAETGFEKMFKDLVREQGSLIVPRVAADTIISGMSDMEADNLDKALRQNGVENRNDFERLLDRWKAEALNPSVSVNIKHTKKREHTVRERPTIHSR